LEFGDDSVGLVTVVTIASTFVASQSENGFIIGKGVVETVGIWLVRLVNVNSVNCGGDLGGKTSFDLWLIIIFIGTLLTWSLGISWELWITL
jgi:hypothetical protein